MDQDQMARATAKAVSDLSASFMLDAATYAFGTDRGFNGVDFYFAGRAGVLGDVPAEVATSALVFLAPDTVAKGWMRSAEVMSRPEAVTLFSECAVRWSGEHLDDGPDWAALSDLAGQIAATASVGGAPLFAGWRSQEVPDEPKAAALWQMNLLRELRMARHGGAVMAVGLDPGDAVRHRTPIMTGIFGWDDADVADDVADRWSEAEALTARASAHDYQVLSDAEAERFADLCQAAMAAVH